MDDGQEAGVEIVDVIRCDSCGVRHHDVDRRRLPQPCHRADCDGTIQVVPAVTLPALRDRLDDFRREILEKYEEGVDGYARAVVDGGLVAVETVRDWLAEADHDER